jgi:hypothetical protein
MSQTAACTYHTPNGNIQSWQRHEKITKFESVEFVVLTFNRTDPRMIRYKKYILYVVVHLKDFFNYTIQSIQPGLHFYPSALPSNPTLWSTNNFNNSSNPVYKIF